VPEYRTPEEEQQSLSQRDRVQRVLDQAAKDAVSVLTAMELGEPEDVVDAWVNRLWDGLRDNLSDDNPDDPCSRLRADEDRLLAIIMLLEDAARREARAIVTAVTS
jgi:hypothetical protein